nr:hypothetical protein [Tanacetum cinerariifolium]GEV82580.1 hypothetical protein [Tanacetum cinerariifolium]
MADLAFAPQHNMVAYLEKTEGNAEFHQIVDFLTSSSIHHALTILATVDGKTVVIKGIIRTATSLFASMLAQSGVVEGEGSGNPPESQPTPSPAQPISEGQILESSSSPQNTQSPRQTLEGIGFPHTRGSNFFDPSMDVEAIHKEGVTVWRSHTGSDEGSMTLKKLTDLCTTLSQKVLDLEKFKTAQAKVNASLKKRFTKLEQRQSSRISGFHPFRAGTSRRHNLSRRNVSKQERKNLKPQQKFQYIDDLVDEGMKFVLDEDADTKVIVEDKGSGKKRGSTTEAISTARPEVSTAAPKTPHTTTTLVDDEDVTIADTLVKMKSQKAKEKGVTFKDSDDSARPIASITTLQPLPTIDPNDKERERQEESSKAALGELYDEVQAQIDVDHKLAARLNHEEQKKYTVEERSRFVFLTIVVFQLDKASASHAKRVLSKSKLLKEKVFILDSDGALMSTQEYMQKVVEDEAEDDDFNSGDWVSATNYVIANGGSSYSPNVLGDLTVTMKDLSGTIPRTIHHKVIGEGGYAKEIIVGVALILANVLVFFSKTINALP